MVELSVTVALIGVVATLAIPSIRRLVPRYKFNSAVSLMHSTVNNARLKSISRNREVRITFSIPLDSYTVEEGNLSSGSTSWAGVESNRMAGNAADIWKLEANTGSGTADMTSLVYLPDGSARFFDGASAIGNAMDGYVYLKGPAGVTQLESRLAVKSITGRAVFQWSRGSTWLDSTRVKN
jgi:Tfp pilus assembly protein FimT